ncbi:MAG: hypothetical protein MUC58_06660 [Rhizobiaceae bacterium]|nr:hypothetical protein [Rhizobiaceae bacterium]
MVDYVVVLRRTIDSLPKNTPDIRERVYVKARQTVLSKLEAVNPPPSPGLIERQMAALDAAIRTIEGDFAEAIVEPEPAPMPEVPVVTAPPTPSMPSKPAGPAKRTEPVVLPSEAAHEPETPGDSLPDRSLPDLAAPPVAPLPPATPATGPAPRIVMPPVMEPLRAPSPPDLPKPAPKAAADLPKQPFEDDFADVFGPDDEAGTPSASLDTPVMPQLPKRAPAARASRGRGWIAPTLSLLVLAGVGAAAYTQRDAIMALIAPSADTTLAQPADGAAPTTPEAAPQTPDPAPADGVQKFTQRLNPDGTETDAGTGGAVGEASFAAFQPGSDPAQAQPGAPALPETPVTPTPEAPVAEAPLPTDQAATDAPAPAEPAAGADNAIAIGQKAIFYEERTSNAEGSAQPGAVVWSVVRESPGGDRPPEPAVRGDLSIPENGLRVRMTLRRNGDTTLPASHILEVVVTTPEGFAGGAIDEVQRVNLKPTEENAGASLVAVPVRVAEGFFLIALDQADAARTRNLSLLAEQNWIDIPVVYRTGRRALFTMEKGLTGQRVFKEVLDAWAAQPLGG